MQPLLYCPALGLCLVLTGGWAHALLCIAAMLCLQLAVGAPFLMTNPGAYLARAFGGPGDLQHAWSVNWRFLPEDIFQKRSFTVGLQVMNVFLLAWFAQTRWIPGGFLSRSIRRWTTTGLLDDSTVIAMWFTCNFVGVACLRTVHFQFLVWYFHSIPFLAWYALQPDRHRGWPWVLRCILVVAITLGVELPYLITGHGLVRGPDGRQWESPGVPKASGSLLLQAVHWLLLLLLALRCSGSQAAEAQVEKSKVS
ncbi:unnamed protein product [Polarella glacialis]|uniref:dolichyl-P-Man:Man5GlcNAc2-PP-dolichol alpha-1,3-mannosyltransferase n=1 Tax=Polarella glacialis TaxID=89957 RepID=A0A813G4V9_POLGL|nr:unnamed protein product [Polarella glacialis]